MNARKNDMQIPGRSRRSGTAESGPPDAMVAAPAATGPAAPPAACANPAALTVAHAARLLGVAEQKIHDHIAAGAPAAAGATINLVHYVAWLNQQLKTQDGD